MFGLTERCLDNAMTMARMCDDHDVTDSEIYNDDGAMTYFIENKYSNELISLNKNFKIGYIRTTIVTRRRIVPVCTLK